MKTTYTKAQVAQHTLPEDLWLVISGEVYDVTKFQHTHPGGQKILKAMAGKDATKPFKKNHNEKILKSFQYRDLCIGVIGPDAPSVVKIAEKGSKLRKILGWKGKDGSASITVVPVKAERVVKVETVKNAMKKPGYRLPLDLVDEKLMEVKKKEEASEEELLPDSGTV